MRVGGGGGGGGVVGRLKPPGSSHTGPYSQGDSQDRCNMKYDYDFFAQKVG